MKKTFRLLLMALPMMLGLSACVDQDNPVISGGEVQAIVAPDVSMPTTDQMSVTVTEDVPTAVLRDFDEGSTGAALARRLPRVTSQIGSDTRLVLVPGSMFDTDTDMTSEELDAIVDMSLKGGYLAMERLTGSQLFNFAVMYVAKLYEKEVLTYQEMYDMDEAAAARAASSSELMLRTKARLANIQQIAKSRGADGFDDVQAEMIAFGPTDYFMQDPFTEKATSYVNTDDSEGNTTEAEAVTVEQERTEYISGELADASADWLNFTEKKNAPTRARAGAMTRASGSSAVNELIDASETFTFNEAIDWRDWNNDTRHSYDRVNMIVRSWGIHNMESDKDYYYMKQNVTLKMGDIFWPLAENSYYTVTGYGDYNRWYGAFLSQYITSMNLTGSGSIQLEAAKPETDNNSSSTSVSIGSSSSKTVTNGMSIGGSMGFSGENPSLSFSASGSHSEGTTEGTSFTLGMSQTSKDLGVKKNTSGSQVTWTYNGTLPQYYLVHSGSNYYDAHQTAAAVLTNDCDLTNEICWSVSNPSGTYSIEITSQPQTAALMTSWRSQGESPHKYEYTTTATSTHSQELLEPNRAMQTWRMNITIDQWEGTPIAGAQGQLESNISSGFPDLYAPKFTVADKTATSLNTITAIINYTKKVLNNRYDILQSYAKSWGIKQFTIHWSCDDTKVKTREGFVVNADAQIDNPLISILTNLNTLAINHTAQDNETLTGTLGKNVKISIAKGATVTLRGVTINGISNYDYQWAGITCEGDATIIIEGTNSVRGFNVDYPGIYVPAGKTLTIKGNGSLTASSNDYGAGIGAGFKMPCGNIVIESGTINATSPVGPGIGSCYNGTCGTITIKGGTVNASGGSLSAGIGSGDEDTTCGKIVIMGGTVTATGGDYGAGIGSGKWASCGDITITNGVTSVTATKGKKAIHSIGQGYEASCGTVTIGGKVGAISESPYTYKP